MLRLISRIVSGSVHLLGQIFSGPGLRYSSYVVPLDEVPLFVVDHPDTVPAWEFLVLMSRSAILSPYLPQARRELYPLMAQHPDCQIYVGRQSRSDRR